MKIELITNNYLDAVAPLIAGARASVWVCQYLIRARPTLSSHGPGLLIKAMATAKINGARCQVFLSAGKAGDHDRRIANYHARWLNGISIPVVLLYAPTRAHAKVVVIDELTTIIGSHNWTMNSLDSGYELSLLLHNPDVARRIIASLNQLDKNPNAHRFPCPSCPE